MLCTNPNYIQKYPINEKLYKKDGSLITHKVRFIAEDLFQELLKNNQKDVFMLRCGKCLACKNFRSFQWAQRLELESKNWNYSYFLTLTYNDNHVHNSQVSDIQKFLKRFRKLIYPQKIKYYWTYELGAKTRRPHFHLIFYSDVNYFQVSDIVQMFGLYKQLKIFNKLWPFGNHYIAFAAGGAYKYTAQYVAKSKNELAHAMSNGIAYKQLTTLDDVYLNGNKVQMPRHLKNSLGIKEEYDIEVYKNMYNDINNVAKSQSMTLKQYNKVRRQENYKKFIRKAIN